MAEQLTALWQEAEEHLQAFQQYARRTVEEAWLAGDALMRIRDQLPHGGWRAGLEERGITKSTAHRFISLRKKYPEMSHLGTFSSVSAALTAKSRTPEIESRISNTGARDQPPAQPKLLDEPQEPSAQPGAHDELQEQPQPQESPQEQPEAAQARDQPSAPPEAVEQPVTPPELQEPPPAQPEAVDEPQEPPQARAQPTPSPDARSPGFEFRQLSSPGSGLPPFRRRPPFPAPGPRIPPPPQEKALPVPADADAHAEPQRRMQLRLRTPRLLLPGSHTAFRLGLSCFVDVDEAAENKNAAPNKEQRPDNPAADSMSGDNM